MAQIDAQSVMKLRSQTGLAMMKCKEALVASDGDLEKAKEYLKKQGLQAAEKRAGRETHSGYVASYVHHDGSIGVLVELSCETDFVARNEEFRTLGRDIAMHVASMRPQYLNADQVDPQALEKERALCRERFLAEGKPEKIVDKIVDGQIGKFLGERCLLEQIFVKAESKETVAEVVNAAIAKIGENIAVRRFVRFEVGES